MSREKGAPGGRPSPTVEDPALASDAALALSMACAALDPNKAHGARPDLAKALLREAVVLVARAYGAPSALGYAPALEALRESGALDAALDGDGAPLTTLDAEAPSVADLGAAERAVMKLCDAAQGKKTTRRTILAARIALALGALAILALVVGYSWTHPWRGYGFHASSAYGTFKQVGQLGDAKPRDLLFHTKEEMQPWVEIDLLRTRRISSVTLKNRLDCCQERGVPLVIEARDMQTGWKQLAQQDTRFDVWTATFDPIDARVVRVRSLGKTILHLREIEVR